MKNFLYRLRLRWICYRNPPFIELSHAGQATSKPVVMVGAIGNFGMQTVYTFAANDQGEASAQLYGRSLANILGRKLVDRRDRDFMERRASGTVTVDGYGKQWYECPSGYAHVMGDDCNGSCVLRG